MTPATVPNVYQAQAIQYRGAMPLVVATRYIRTRRLDPETVGRRALEPIVRGPFDVRLRRVSPWELGMRPARPRRAA